jgi:putative signal transducing protein
VAVRIHQANDQTSAEVMAGRLRAEGIPAQIIQADAGAPYGGFGMSSAFDILVPDDQAAKARALLAKGDADTRRGRKR